MSLCLCPRQLYRLFAGIFSSLGIVDSLVWIITQREAYAESTKHSSLSDGLSRVTTTRLLDKVGLVQWPFLLTVTSDLPQLNYSDISRALRKEFITYTSMGIREAVRCPLCICAQEAASDVQGLARS